MRMTGKPQYPINITTHEKNKILLIPWPHIYIIQQLVNKQSKFFYHNHNILIPMTY